MRSRNTLIIFATATVLYPAAAGATINTVVIHNDNEHTTADFKLKAIPSPAKDDAAAKATIAIIDGRRDRNGGDVEKLSDGEIPNEADQPSENFFFNAGTAGGRLLVDLGSPVAIEQINTYSWHPSTRGPQVYALYASDGTGQQFHREPKNHADPEQSGWKLVARVDTRPAENDGPAGGQYGVSIFDSDGALGSYRYLLFDVSRTEDDDPFGNTFYSEIDVVASSASDAHKEQAPRANILSVDIQEGDFHFTVDTSETPDLTQWAEQKLAPVVNEWYPRIVAMLPSDGFDAPKSFSITFSPSMRGVAATGGTRIGCSADWFRQNLEGEAIGAIVHELVHVVQQYGRARRDNARGARPPGWLVEGIADYIRWFLFEPQSRGAEIGPNNLARARHDGSYRVSANFLNWVTEHYDRDIVPKLNAAIRTGEYDEDIWSNFINRTLEELGDEWKAGLERRAASDAGDELSASGPPKAASRNEQEPNQLVDDERSDGWMLLFDGERLDHWHSFGADGVRPGWQVVGGVLTCVDPHDAGDLCTNAEFDWFELSLEYNISKGGNSGIMYHVTDEAAAAWATGPEFQLQDNAGARDPILCGWLYGLYQPPTDPNGDKPLDATKPAGEWNQIRLRISPDSCVHEINGVKYFEYVLGSEDFNNRVANSKFRKMPLFAKTGKGYIALQGDHGQVSFRNIKIRPIVISE